MHSFLKVVHNSYVRNFLAILFRMIKNVKDFFNHTVFFNRILLNSIGDFRFRQVRDE